MLGAIGQGQSQHKISSTSKKRDRKREREREREIERERDREKERERGRERERQREREISWLVVGRRAILRRNISSSRLDCIDFGRRRIEEREKHQYLTKLLPTPLRSSLPFALLPACRRGLSRTRLKLSWSWPCLLHSPNLRASCLVTGPTKALFWMRRMSDCIWKYSYCKSSSSG
jgi:hypothetical protein